LNNREILNSYIAGNSPSTL